MDNEILRRAKQKLRYDIADLKAVAHARGGDCLADSYFGQNVRVKWICSMSHTWMSSTKSVVGLGTWCPHCAGKAKLTLGEMKRVAQERRGKCLSLNYKHANAKLTWECALGHVWEATGSQIRNANTWCPTCGVKKIAAALRKYTIADMKTIAMDRSGECLSDNFISVDQKLRWRCSEGHEWNAIPSSIKKGTWCPICASYLNERICRKHFELLFQCDFPKTKPLWLHLGKRKILELDGYSQRLGIAFEYHGRQHFENVGHFQHDLAKRIYYDRIKRERCRLQGILLIEVPHTIESNRMESFIRSECHKAKISVPRKTTLSTDELRDAFLTNSQELINLRFLAQSKKGSILTQHYANAITNMLWKCEHGHTWLATPNSIKNNHTWCPHCAGNTLDTIETMCSIASKLGGYCLSTEYVNQSSKLRWKCKEGHEWDAIPRNVKNIGHWCPYCSGRKLWVPSKNQSEARLDELRAFAIKRKGFCLSKSYKNAFVKLIWQCVHEHQWEANANSIKRGTWCPYCAGLRIWNPHKSEEGSRLEQLQSIAISHGGRCLAKKYEGQRRKVLWQCAEGHQWYAKPSHIIHSRSWCPLCAAMKKRNMIDKWKV